MATHGLITLQSKGLSDGRINSVCSRQIIHSVCRCATVQHPPSHSPLIFPQDRSYLLLTHDITISTC